VCAHGISQMVSFLKFGIKIIDCAGRTKRPKQRKVIRMNCLSGGLIDLNLDLVTQSKTVSQTKSSLSI
jgi:hypothetical protein